MDYTEVPDILEACHDSACGGHFSGRLTGQKILRADYYSPILFADNEAYAKKCDACQRYAWNDLYMDLPLHPTLPISPLEKWGIDYIGPIAPMSSKRNQYIIIAVEYLTKWAQTKAIKDSKQLTPNRPPFSCTKTSSLNLATLKFWSATEGHIFSTKQLRK